MRDAKDLRNNSLNELIGTIELTIYRAAQYGALYTYINHDDDLLINLDNHPEKDKVIETLLKHNYRIDTTHSGGMKISW